MRKGERQRQREISALKSWKEKTEGDTGDIRSLSFNFRLKALYIVRLVG